MNILQLPILEDNYCYILFNATTKEAAVVDPGTAGPVIAALNANHLNLTAVLLTHHHWDHIGGVDDLLEKFPGIAVYAGSIDQSKIQGVTAWVEDGQVIPMLESDARVLFLPGHSAGHVAYYFEKQQALFCGDVLFSLGCGRIFDGTMEQLFDSLNRIQLLPDDTQIYCGHEYTQQNINFALSLQGSHDGLRQKLVTIESLRATGKSTVPSTLGEEKQLNPFLRTHDPELQKVLGLPGAPPSEVFRALRHRKDEFK